MYFAFQTPKYLYMVLEYCSNGDLMTHLSERSRFPEIVAKLYIAETILAFAGHSVRGPEAREHTVR